VVKYGQYPNETLLKVPVKLKIATILLLDAEMHYIEKQAVTYKTGDGFFTHVSGVISNLTNDSAWLAANSHMTVKMTGNFLHSGKMVAGFGRWSFYSHRRPWQGKRQRTEPDDHSFW
jgi:hypothetical protein